MDVSKNRGTPKWMVYNDKPLLKWMIWGYQTPIWILIGCFWWMLLLDLDPKPVCWHFPQVKTEEMCHVQPHDV